MTLAWATYICADILTRERLLLLRSDGGRAYANTYAEKMDRPSRPCREGWRPGRAASYNTGAIQQQAPQVVAAANERCACGARCQQAFSAIAVPGSLVASSPGACRASHTPERSVGSRRPFTPIEECFEAVLERSVDHPRAPPRTHHALITKSQETLCHAHAPPARSGPPDRGDESSDPFDGGLHRWFRDARPPRARPVASV